jgi:hypothetical protein
MTRVRSWSLAAVVLAALAAPGCARQKVPGTATSAGRVTNPRLDELSGLARSAAHPGFYWAHNDGGHEPRLFALRADGSVHVPSSYAGKKAWAGTLVLGASNVDWEDIALADGLLYVADVGNNRNARRDLGVYVVSEPSPDEETARALRFIPVVYPDQTTFPANGRAFDCEAVFADGGKLYFLTKYRRRENSHGSEEGTQLYRLATFDTTQANPLERVSTHPRIRSATAADLSPNGARLAVLTYTRVWIFRRPARGDDWLAGEATTIELPRTKGLQAEAIAWIDDASVLVGSEDRTLLRVAVPAAAPQPQGHARAPTWPDRDATQ